MPLILVHTNIILKIYAPYQLNQEHNSRDQNKDLILLCLDDVLLMFVYTISRAKTTVSLFAYFIIKRHAIFYKNPLHKSFSLFDGDSFLFIGIVCNFCKNMSLIIRLIIITANNSYCII